MSSEIRVLKDKRNDVTVLPKTVAEAVSYGNESVADELASLSSGLAGKTSASDFVELTDNDIDTLWAAAQ